MEGAIQLIKKAIEFENKEHYNDALVCYREGIDLLLKYSKQLNNAKEKDVAREKIATYMDRAETIKKKVEATQSSSGFYKKIEITDGQLGFSYDTVFSKFIDDKLTQVTVADAYIRVHHQLANLVRFAELLVKKAKNLNSIHLITVDATATLQTSGFENLQLSLKNYGVTFSYEFSETLHDREIKFNNGWVIKIGRGLDYFKGKKEKFSIGVYDYDLRPCFETMIDIYKVNPC